MQHLPRKKKRNLYNKKQRGDIRIDNKYKVHKTSQKKIYNLYQKV